MPPEEERDPTMQDGKDDTHQPDPEGTDDSAGGSTKGGPATDPDQERIDREIERRLARDRRKWEKRLERAFGTRDLDQAGQVYRAGQLVVQQSGRSPGDVISRLSQYGRQGTTTPTAAAGNQSPPVDDAVRRELAEIRETLMLDREQQMREKQQTEARKEFGQLYDQHADDIEDLAEERGLSLADAAAIVLRPHLKEHYQRQAQSRQQTQRRRQVDASDQGPAGGDAGGDYGSRLSDQEKRVALKTIPGAKTPQEAYKRYYESKRRLGRAGE